MVGWAQKKQLRAGQLWYPSWMREAWVVATYLLATLAFDPGAEGIFVTPKGCCLSLLLAGLAWKKTLPRWPLWVWAWAAWPLVGLLGCQAPWAGLSGLAIPLLAGVAFLVLPPLDEELRLAVRRALSTGGIVTLTYLIAQAFGWDLVEWVPGSLLGSFFGNPNFAADFLLLALCLGKFPSGIWGFVGRALLILGIVWCRSRGVWLMLGVWFLANYPQIDLVWRRVALGTLGALLVVAVWVWRDDVPQGFLYMVHPEQYVAAASAQPADIDLRDPWFRGKRASLVTRYLMWLNTLAAIGEAPLFGSGAGQFRTVYPVYSDAVYPDINMSETYRTDTPHNLVLELLFQFGAVWLALGVWVFWRWGKGFFEDRAFFLAVALQLFLAMVGLNYQNAVIVVTLLLLRPGGFSQSGGRVPAWVVTGPLVLFCLALYALDHPSLRVRGPWAERLFPAELATAHYEQGDLPNAWRAQHRAVCQDPAGPETVHNLGLIAYACYQEHGDRRWLVEASAATLFVTQRYPFFTPAQAQWALLGRLDLPPTLEELGTSSAKVFRPQIPAEGPGR